MKALVVRQPWAWLIVHGIKDVENRAWATDHRGPLLIVAGVSEEDLCHLPRARQLAGNVALPDTFDRGGIVGYVTVAGMSRPDGHPSPWAEGPVCWDLADAHPLPFRPYSGLRGLFDIPGETVPEIVPGTETTAP